MSILNPFGTSASSGESLPIGSVILWAGTLETIPTGWHLCDGEDGTIDLRGTFALGAGGTYNLGDNGGSEEVTLTVAQMPTHSHACEPGSDTGSVNSSTPRTVNVSATNTWSTLSGSAIRILSAGSSQPHSNMPPYKALYYIQKIA